ncbi:MAG: hypothetical protein PHI84_13265 [Kiritimatiellae bacterium]|nr:hypothetical protein [Kiritimatiellia bacterium]
MKTNKKHSAVVICCLAMLFTILPWGCAQIRTTGALFLENERLALRFDRNTGTLTAIQNKLTGENYSVSGDEFAVEVVDFRHDFAEAKVVSLKHRSRTLEACYRSGDMTIEVTYTLERNHHFAEKQITIISSRDYGLRKVVLSRPVFSADKLVMTCYRYPQFGRAPGKEPISTFFGRTPKGGFFTGIEMPFDVSSLSERQVVLAYAPSLKVKAGERFVCEPVYFGVYQRHTADDQSASSLIEFMGKARREFQPKSAGTKSEEVPLQSESDAMVAMTSAILGPPRFGLVPMACGWHSEMQHGTYTSDKMVDEEMKSLDFLTECGIDWVSDSHPWGGETTKMNVLGADDKYIPGELVTKFLEHARKKDIKVVMWSSMNNTHHWGGGQPFRADKPEWLMTPKTLDGKPDIIKRAKANCFANTPFFNWLSRINNDGLATGYYKAWCMDGSFFGDGGWYTTVIPVDCASDMHDHLSGDSNYACQKALEQLFATVRQQCPDIYTFTCRPLQDLGTWSLKNVNVCFTQLESGTGKDNLAAGDLIRTWSRARVRLDFFPHYLDQPLLFPSRYINDKRPFNWPSEKFDYIMLSALSSSPNQLYYMPTKTGIPAKDKVEIRKWLDWGHKNVEYLKVRKDLPDWPAVGKVDGSAHIVGNQGLIFLFNSGKTPLEAQFALTEESIGLMTKGSFLVTQEYPVLSQEIKAAYGNVVRWQVPGETTVILRLKHSN